MTTTEIIEGKEITIDWDFIEVQERHDNNWCEWTVEGIGNDNNFYLGSCQADGGNPENFHDDKIEDIELQKPIIPTPKKTPYEWLKDIIESCNTPIHFNACKTIMELYEARYGFTNDLVTLSALLIEREVSLKHFDKVSETY